MATWTGWFPSRRTVTVLATLAACGCSDGTHPRDPHAGTYGAVLWTQEIHGSAPYNQLGVDGASYTVRLESDGHASRRIIVPGGLDGGPSQPDTLGHLEPGGAGLDCGGASPPGLQRKQRHGVD